MANRAKPHLMTGSENPSQVFTELKYRTGDSREAIESENYFLPCRGHFNGAGDEIAVRRDLDDGAWEKATYEVTFEDRRRVTVARITQWRRGGKRPDPDLEAVYAGCGKWDVLYADSGKPFRRGVTRRKAELLAKRPPGEAADASRRDRKEA